MFLCDEHQSLLLTRRWEFINHQSSMNFQCSTSLEKTLSIENLLMIDD